MFGDVVVVRGVVPAPDYAGGLITEEMNGRITSDEAASSRGF